MRCPHCGEEITDQDFQDILMEIFENVELVRDFTARQVGFLELKAAADNLRMLEEKYLGKGG